MFLHQNLYQTLGCSRRVFVFYTWLEEWQRSCLSDCEFATKKSTSTANEAKVFQTLYTHYVLVCGELKYSVLLSSYTSLSLYNMRFCIIIMYGIYSIFWLYASLPIKVWPQWSTMWFYVLFTLRWPFPASLRLLC